MTVADGLELAKQNLASRNYNGAVSLCRRILQVEADNPHALHMLAIVANKSGKAERALEIAERALATRRDDPMILNTIGLILTKLNRLDEAEQRLRESLEGDTGQKETWLNLAALKERQSDFTAALDILADFEGRFGPGAAVLSLRALVLQNQGEFTAALELLEAAEKLAPEDIDIRFTKANLLLLLGRMEEGWPGFEMRRYRDLGREPPIARPIWPGSFEPGTRLLLYAEHGLGDVVQFARYVPYLIDRGLVVTFACYPELLSLMRSLSDPGYLIPNVGAMPDCDYVAPLMSLPRLLGHGLAEIAEVAARNPYLSPDPEAAARHRAELDKLPGIKVGITWQGNPNQATDRDRSIPITHYERLMALENVTIVSLQRGIGERDIDPYKDRYRIVDWPKAKVDISDTAELIAALDLVITSDTSIPHVAAAQGKPTWLLLMAKPAWRWLLDRSDSPWYPSMRLFRQQTFRDWTPVFEEVEAALVERKSA